MLIIIIGIFVGEKRHEDLWALVVALPAIALIIILTAFCGNSADNSYTYKADIHINNENKTIYFSSFTQDNNVVTIYKGYAIGNEVHWLDFNNYSVYDEPLTITLTDNAGKFVYYDRVKKITYNKNLGASQ